MDLTVVTLPAAWIVAGWAFALPLLAMVMRVAPWQRFGASEPVHVWYGAIFGVVALWSIQATVGAGFTFHLLGVAAFALLVGAPLALAGTAIAVAVNVAVRNGIWANAALVWLAMAAIPVGTSWLVLRLAERALPANFFVYIFVVTFFGGALSLVTAGVAGALLLTFAAGLPAELVFGEYVPYLLYLAFGEATLTGMVLTLAVAYRPQWVATFDDARYLTGR
jgi:uncharacterized membrane protein